MSLGTKIILLFASFLVLHSLFSFGLRKVIEEPTYIETEEKMMHRELEWFSNLLDSEAYEIGLLCKSFSKHKGLYDYMTSGSNELIKAELEGSMCNSLEVNILVMLDADNNVVYSYITDEDFNTPVKIDGFSAEQWAGGHPLLGFEGGDDLKTGLMKVRENVVIVASCPISAPEDASNIVGTLVFGKLLSGKYLEKLASIHGISIDVVSVADAGFREGETITENYFYMEKAGEGKYKTLLAVNNVAGKPSLAIKANISSDIASKSRRAKRIALVSELGFALAAVMIMLYLIYNIMGKRLERLIDHIIGIRHSGVLVKMVQESSGDEIDLLGYEFNQMVARLQRDIELRMQVETELKRSLTELERFADVASHDLQEPLRSVASCLQLLELQYKENIDDQGKQLIEYAVQGSRRMKTLIKALLAYSNIGNTGLEIAKCDCNQIIKEAVDELKKEIDDVEAEVICDNLPVIQADKFRLLLMFTNIIDNALKYSVPGRKPLIRVNCEKVDNSWRFSISDNGIGIDKDYYQQIFVAFKRLHTQEEHEGSGIGLAICRRIVEQHGGRIWVKSEPGKGSTFYFSIPE
ncbi:MAG: ATP-binding protein [Sedimentisphaeraceae bacterium JB056]